MYPSNYTQRRDDLSKAFPMSIDIKEHGSLTAKFNIVSASLSNYLPGIDCRDHERIFKDILLHQQLSHLEQASHEALQNTCFENLNDNISAILKGATSIICTFHTGSYRLINLFLVKNRIPFSLVIASNVIKTQGGLFNQLYRELMASGDGDGFMIINAEQPSAGLQMLKSLKQGRSLLLYMDGNTGAGGAASKNENHCLISFLNQMLFARKGIGFLAHAANVPILPVACYRKSLEDIRIKFFEAIYPDRNEERGLFAARSTQAIYDLFAPIIERYPEQWEAWLYLHRSAHIIRGYQGKAKPPFSRDRKLSLNTSLYSVFDIAGKAFLFNRNTYLSYPIDGSLYSLLSGGSILDKEMNKSSQGLLEQLYRNDVLEAA